MNFISASNAASESSSSKHRIQFRSSVLEISDGEDKNQDLLSKRTPTQVATTSKHELNKGKMEEILKRKQNEAWSKGGWNDSDYDFVASTENPWWGESKANINFK